jgi:hypothetical protein
MFDRACSAGTRVSMSRRTLLFREPLRRRPFGERPVSASHAGRRDRPSSAGNGPTVRRRPSIDRRACA